VIADAGYVFLDLNVVDLVEVDVYLNGQTWIHFKNSDLTSYVQKERK